MRQLGEDWYVLIGRLCAWCRTYRLFGFLTRRLAGVVPFRPKTRPIGAVRHTSMTSITLLAVPRTRNGRVQEHGASKNRARARTGGGQEWDAG